MSKILHAEDYPVWFERIKPMFEGTDFEYVAVKSGDEALEILDESFEAVIADFNMPGRTSGIDVVLRALELGIEKVVMFTADPSGAEYELKKRTPKLMVPVYSKRNNLALTEWIKELTQTS